VDMHPFVPPQTGEDRMDCLETGGYGSVDLNKIALWALESQVDLVKLVAKHKDLDLHLRRHAAGSLVVDCCDVGWRCSLDCFPWEDWIALPCTKVFWLVDLVWWQGHWSAASAHPHCCGPRCSVSVAEGAVTESSQMLDLDIVNPLVLAVSRVRSSVAVVAYASGSFSLNWCPSQLGKALVAAMPEMVVRCPPHS